MSSSILCCNAIEPYRPRHLDHEVKFTRFMAWARYPRTSDITKFTVGNNAELESSFAIQLVRQVNYGALEWKKYFIPSQSQPDEFIQIAEDDLLQANFQKLNTYKNYKCTAHNKFFEVNVYQKDPVNRHHWRANLARPSRDIDLETQDESPVSEAGRQTMSGGSIRSSEVTVPSPDLFTVAGSGMGERWSMYDRDDSPPKDFTACDKECGYCGQCDY